MPERGKSSDGSPPDVRALIETEVAENVRLLTLIREEPGWAISRVQWAAELEALIREHVDTIMPRDGSSVSMQTVAAAAESLYHDAFGGRR